MILCKVIAKANYSMMRKQINNCLEMVVRGKNGLQKGVRKFGG